MTDTERFDWLIDQIWNGWSIGGSHQYEGGKPHFWLEHKSGRPHFDGPNLRELFDAAMATKEKPDET